MGSVLVIGQVGEGTCDQLGGSLREELASMREQLDSLAQKVMGVSRVAEGGWKRDD